MRKPIKVNNIADLRAHALNTLDMLVTGNIELEEAAAASNLYNNVMGMCKLELDYRRVTGHAPAIDFFDTRPTHPTTIDAEQIKALESKFRGV